jgi:ribosome-binding factor A
VNHRTERIQSLIAKNITDIVSFELKKKGIGMPSVNEVQVNADCSMAKVYVSFIGAKHPQDNFRELSSCAGYVRSSLAKKMDIYKVPEVVFVYDDSYERQESLERALSKEAKDLEKAKKGR